MAKDIETTIKNGGVTTPKGFLANGAACGIKQSGKKDLAILYSQVPAAAACAFTTNVFAAAPVRLSKAHLRARFHQAIIVNSGNANCANGSLGDSDAKAMAHAAAKGLALSDRNVLVASTGIIGRRLPIAKIGMALSALLDGLSSSGGRLFSEAILTTDNVRKEASVRVKLGASTVTIGGAAKGVGMIYPDLKVASRHATMLCFITTDADIEKASLNSALGEAVDESFNMISVDGDMSTNDSVFLLANGLAGNRKITGGGNDFGRFKAALKYLTKELAKKIVSDGEGATKLIEVVVKGARSHNDAKSIARKVTTSNLLKACVYGEDPNWGRVAASCGSSGAAFVPARTDMYFGGIKVLSNGAGISRIDRAALRGVFKKKNIYIKIDLKSGHAGATAWTCDLSEEYVRINSAYST